MVKKVEQTSIFQNMQTKGLITPRSLHSECFTLTNGIRGRTNTNNS